MGPEHGTDAAVEVDALVIGAGVIGLAVAAELARRGRDVLVVEAEEAIGTQTSSRNSEVIHAGLYYPTGSRKAEFCVRGNPLLYEFCASHGVPCRRIGKVVVAVADAEIAVLQSYVRQAEINGAVPLQWLSGAQVQRLEPAVSAVAGLWSSSTGIIDSHAYMLALQAELEAHGGMIAFHAPVLGGSARAGSLQVLIGGAAPMRLQAQIVVNAAGLHAPHLARQIAGVDAALLPDAYFALGHYFAYSGRPPFQHLVYPIAESGGLGVHVTLDLAGNVRFGPDVKWLDAPDYRFDDGRLAGFIAAIARYFPGVDAARLHPGYTGIRPKISAPDAPAADFLLLGPNRHGVPGLMHLLGIESPGLTASLPIASAVAGELLDSLR